MARYIDAEKLKDSIDSQTDSIFNWGKTTEELYHDLCELVDDEPTADVQETRHGKWEATELMYENGCTRCSECKTEYYASDLEEICGDTFPTYCPLCGARMDGDSK
ncbi:hypothetical protein [uncultured Ruminococcus sp.]|uniref:hypothetical protein n=1 Tax=uncultured Ruminococcus sp. TaxID=165186 RepID=UPI0025F68897|nr:hypothetical protein [uncultured Ruminococcus sp.]